MTTVGTAQGASPIDKKQGSLYCVEEKAWKHNTACKPANAYTILMEKKLNIANQLDQLTLLASFTEEVCEELGLGADMVFNLNLVLEEALTNVIMYAFPEGGDHMIGLTALSEDGVLSFTIQDDGIAFDPTEAPEADVTLSAEERPIGGLGIFLIRQIMDEVTYERANDCNVLTMKKKL